MVKNHDHGNTRSFQNISKDHPLEIQKPFMHAWALVVKV
jgi:hypothetical protein